MYPLPKVTCKPLDGLPQIQTRQYPEVWKVAPFVHQSEVQSIAGLVGCPKSTAPVWTHEEAGAGLPTCQASSPTWSLCPVRYIQEIGTHKNKKGTHHIG